MGQKRALHSFKKSAEAYDFLVNLWESISSWAIAERGRFTVALSGGRTPGDFFRRLAGKPDLPWEKTHIFQVDERFVSKSDNKSNLLLITETLTNRVSIPDDNVHPIATEGITPEESANEYEVELRRFFHAGKLPRFDLIMLGIGEDGHTASLFPESPCLYETERLVLAVVTKGFPRERISLTLPVINNARSVVFLVIGKNKAPVIKEILEKNNSLLPAALVRPMNGTLIFILDQRVSSLF